MVLHWHKLLAGDEPGHGAQNARTPAPGRAAPASTSPVAPPPLPAFSAAAPTSNRPTVVPSPTPWPRPACVLQASGPGADRNRLLKDLNAMKAMGLTQLRILAATEGPDSEPWRIVPSLTPVRALLRRCAASAPLLPLPSRSFALLRAS